MPSIKQILAGREWIIPVLLMVTIIGAGAWLYYGSSAETCQISLLIKGETSPQVIKCGLYREKQDRYQVFAKLLDAKFNNRDLLQVKLETIEDNSVKQRWYVVGKRGHYTWWYVVSGGYLNHVPGYYSNQLVVIDDQLLQRIREYKGQVISFHLIKNASKILLANPASLKPEYRDDLKFRQQYFTRCQSWLGSYQPEMIAQKCAYVFINSISVYEN